MTLSLGQRTTVKASKITRQILKRMFHLATSTKTSITTLQCISASGNVLPPAVCFPGKTLNPEYCLGFPKNVFLGFSDNGWRESYHFLHGLLTTFLYRYPQSDQWYCSSMVMALTSIILPYSSVRRMVSFYLDCHHK